MKTILSTLAIAITLVLPMTSQATERPHSPFTFTAGLGLVKSNDSSREINDRLARSGHLGQVTTLDTERLGGSLWLGWEMRDQLRLELGYLDFGEIEAAASGQIADINQFKTDFADALPQSVKAVALALRPTYAISEQVDLYGRAGVMHWQSQRDISGVPDYNVEDEGFGQLLGAGIDWQFHSHWRIGLGWDRGFFDSEHADMFSVFVTFD